MHHRWAGCGTGHWETPQTLARGGFGGGGILSCVEVSGGLLWLGLKSSPLPLPSPWNVSYTTLGGQVPNRPRLLTLLHQLHHFLLLCHLVLRYAQSDHPQVNPLPPTPLTTHTPRPHP